MPLWAGIVRVSYVGERGGDRFHADREQIDDLERGVARMGAGHRLEILTPELDVSGGLPLERRPSLLAAVEGVEAGRYAGIIVSYLSRLGRNVREQLRAWDRVEAAGGRIVVVREGIDTSTASGRLQRNLLLSIAEHEREAHAERFEERRRLATAAGIWQRRQTPTGYRRDPATRRLVPDEKAAAVRDAFRARAAGVSTVELGRRLGMTSSGVRQMLANRVYLGELRVGTHSNLEAHPPLVTVEEWEAAQITQPRAARNSRVPALLAGLVRCAGCGHVMPRTGTDRAYSCVVNHSLGRCQHPAAVTARLLDEHVTAVALHELHALSAKPATRLAAGDARERLQAAERELAAYLAAVSAADVGAHAFAEGARARRERVEDAQAEVQRIASRVVVPLGGDVRVLWEGLNGHERNVLLRGLLEAVVVRRGGGRGSRTPLTDRVLVLAAGADVGIPRGVGGSPAPLVALHIDVDDPHVLRVPGVHDPLES